MFRDSSRSRLLVGQTTGRRPSKTRLWWVVLPFLLGVLSTCSPRSPDPTGPQITSAIDTIPPAPVGVLTATVGASWGDATQLSVEWLAVGDDSMKGMAATYEIRYADYPITWQSWNVAKSWRRVISTTPAGESMGVSGIIPRLFGYLFITIRARDERGNISPIGANTYVVAKSAIIDGVVRNQFTDAPIEGALI